MFFQGGLNFSCKRCSHCCRHEPGSVFLSREDLSCLCKSFSLSMKDFISSYCRCVPYFDGTLVVSLQEKSNYDCIFWDQGCTVYNSRPVQCRTYPFWTGILDNETSWKDEARHCPGICTEVDSASNSHVPFEKISAILDEYRKNEPLRFNLTEFDS